MLLERQKTQNAFLTSKKVINLAWDANFAKFIATVLCLSTTLAPSFSHQLVWKVTELQRKSDRLDNLCGTILLVIEPQQLLNIVTKHRLGMCRHNVDNFNGFSYFLDTTHACEAKADLSYTYLHRKLKLGSEHNFWGNFWVRQQFFKKNHLP